MATPQLNKFINRSDQAAEVKTLIQAAKGQKQQFLDFLNSAKATVDADIIIMNNDLFSLSANPSGFFTSDLVTEVQGVSTSLQNAIDIVKTITFTQ